MSARLSVPSYVVPGTYVENLRFLEDKPDFGSVELLFFMYDDEVHDLLLRELPDILAMSDRFRYTVHMPDEVVSGHEDIVRLLDPVADAYILHPPRHDAGLPAFVELLDDWRPRWGAERFLLENTTLQRFDAAEAALVRSRSGPPLLCADVGHLMLQGVSPAEWLVSRGTRVRELHVHGVSGGTDHVPFDTAEPWVTSLAPFVHSFEGVVELELFDWQQIAGLAAPLRTAWNLV